MNNAYEIEMSSDHSNTPRENPVETIFSNAMALDPTERAAYLDEACRGDEALRSRAQALLDAAREVPTKFLNGNEDISEENAGDRIGPYTLRMKIGAGGFGVVWKATQETPLRREVALKIIKIGMNTREVVARFKAESQALAAMDHPNIAKVFDAGSTDNGRPFFVMELINGTKIDRYCDDHRYSVRQRLSLFIQLCQAIQHAHVKGIIHRDITPSNVLVVEHDGVPVVKVIDFGIAKAIRETSNESLTNEWSILGAAAYMSPEQAAGGRDIDARTDIYGLGALLYELLVGKTPLETEGLRKLAMDVMCRTIRELDRSSPSARLRRLKDPELTDIAKRRQVDAPKLPKLLGGELEWIVMKCLEKNQNKRWEDTRQLLENLQAYLGDKVIPDPAYKFRRLQWLKKAICRHKLSLGLLTAGIAAGLYYWHLPGTLELDVIPPDASIQIDGHPLHAASMPVEIKWAAGFHTVTCSKEGYETQGPFVLFRRNAMSEPLKIVLNHYQGQLNVQSYPPGAAIHIGGVDYFERITTNQSFDTGTYDLSAFADGCFDIHHTITIHTSHLTVDRFSLERGISWKYTLPGIQGGLIIITNTPPNTPPVLVHNELDGVVFLSSDDGQMMDSIPTSEGNKIAFKEFDLGGDAGKVIVWGYEDASSGVFAQVLKSAWPKQILWSCHGPPAKFKDDAGVEVEQVPGSNAVANLVFAGRDGHARIYSGRTGALAWDIELSKSPLYIQPTIRSWRQGGHIYLSALYQDAITKPETKLALFDVPNNKCLWRENIGQNKQSLFVDFDQSSKPWILIWSDKEWQLVNALNGELSKERKLPGPLIGQPALVDLDGTGTNAIVFAFTNRSLPMLAVRPSDGSVLWEGPTNLDDPQFDTSRTQNYFPHIGPDILLVRLSDSLAAIDARTGKSLWKISGKVRQALADNDHNCIYASIENLGILCLDSTGKTNWLLRLREDDEPWAVVPTEYGESSNLLLHRGAGSISSVHWPRLLWEADASGPLQATPLVAKGSDGKPIVIQLGPWGNDVTIRALDGINGSLVWDANDSLSPNRSPALADMDNDGSTDLVTVNDYLLVKRASDGKLIRAPGVAVASWMTGTPAVADFRGIGSNDVAVSTWDNPCIALIDGHSGRVLWRVSTDGPNMDSIAAADLDGDGLPDVLATSFDGHVYAIRGRDGTLLWKTSIGPEGSWSVPTVADLNNDGRKEVIVTTADGRLFVLNGKDGKVLWSPDLVGELKVTGRAKVASINGENVIIVPMGNAGLVAYDWKRRTELWPSPNGYPVIASGVVCDLAHNGKKQVVVATTGGDIFIIRLTDGKPLWHIKTGQGLTEADPVVADLNGDGVDDILIANYDSHLYAIDGKKIISAINPIDR